MRMGVAKDLAASGLIGVTSRIMRHVIHNFHEFGSCCYFSPLRKSQQGDRGPGLCKKNHHQKNHCKIRGFCWPAKSCGRLAFPLLKPSCQYSRVPTGSAHSLRRGAAASAPGRRLAWTQRSIKQQNYEEN
jgi:hypothetical protein